MPRNTVPPTVVDGEFAGDKETTETHPAFAVIGASRVQRGPGGSTLFDSDIQHNHTIRIRIATAVRHRSLNRDWITDADEFVEVELSEAQWASFVSSMNVGVGVPCTLRRREDDWDIPEIPFEPRLGHSMDEVRGAAEKYTRKIKEAFDAYEAKKSAENLRTLKYTIENAPSNMTFAAKSLTEHAENVVQKARVDIESMVVATAHQLGLDPSELGETGQLTTGKDETA